jgi:hypothetical protein
MVVVGFVVAACGCSVGSNKTDDIEKRLSDLEVTVKQQQETLDEQTSTISGINSDNEGFLSRIGSLENLHSDSAYLSSDSLDSYVVVRAVAGDLLVMLEDCVKYMDGYKLKLKIGNPSSATYSDFTITGQWPQFRAGRSGFIIPSTKTKTTRTQTYAGNLPGGSWTRIDFVATPATADDMKGVKLTFDTNTVSLKGGS